MAQKKTTIQYKILKWLVRTFYPRTRVIDWELVPGEDAVIVGNHAQMNGPIVSELYLPEEHYTWCAGQMMDMKEVPAYAYADFWSQKPPSVRWFYRILSYVIAPLSVCLFNNANTIPVYHDTRILTTFRESIGKLRDGARIVIFPEQAKPYNGILCDFQDRFIELARMYYKKTGRVLSFVPMYVAPALRSVYFGKPIRYDPQAGKEEERRRIRQYLMDAITALAVSLPEHTVVPYQNISKKLYPKNRPTEASHHEETDL